MTGEERLEFFWTRHPRELLNIRIQDVPWLSARREQVETWLKPARIIQACSRNTSDIWKRGGVAANETAALRAKTPTDGVSVVYPCGKESWLTSFELKGINRHAQQRRIRAT